LEPIVIDPDRPPDLVGMAEDVLLVENAPTALAAVVSGGRLVMANRALRELLGYGLEELAGRSVTELLDRCHADFGHDWHTPLEAAIERPIRLRRSDGSSLAARITTVVVRDQAAVPQYVLCAVLGA
jgi:PAS domain S-box-containing protein